MAAFPISQKLRLPRAFKVDPYKSLTYEIRHQPIVFALVSDSSCHDRGAEGEPACKLADLRLCADPFQFGLGFSRKKLIACPRIRFGFRAVVLALSLKVIHKPAYIALPKVQSYVRKFVRETEPEVVETVVSKGQANDWRPVWKERGRPVDTSLGQRPFYHQMYAVLA